MKKTLFVLIIVFFSIGLFSKILVLPFRTEKNIDKSHFWFSRAFSYYLSTKLLILGEDVITDYQTKGILEDNSINIPYRFTKASAIKIGLENDASIIIWGDLISNKGDKSNNIIVRPYIINLKSFKQYYLPIIKSGVMNLSLIQSELFNVIKKKLNILKTDNNILINNQSYELFIKSLLTSNYNERKHLLLNSLNLIKEKNIGKEIITFELANLYFNNDDFNNAALELKKIDNNSVMAVGKSFLSALMDYNNEDFEKSLKGFLKLKRKNLFETFIDNNLGVLSVKIGNSEEAEKYLQNAVKEENSVSYNNILHLYMENNDFVKLKKTLISALNYDPEDVKFISLFYYLIGRDNNKNILLSVFNDLIEEDRLIDYYKLEFKLELLNPFSETSNNNPVNLNKKEMDLLLLEDYLAELERNPFNYRTHLMVSKIYFRDKKFRKAEIFGIAALFLNNSQLCIDNMIEIYNALGKTDKVRELKKR